VTDRCDDYIGEAVDNEQPSGLTTKRLQASWRLALWSRAETARTWKSLMPNSAVRYRGINKEKAK